MLTLQSLFGVIPLGKKERAPSNMRLSIRKSTYNQKFGEREGGAEEHADKVQCCIKGLMSYDTLKCIMESRMSTWCDVN